MIDAKVRLGRADALEFAAAASTVIVAKGKKVLRFNMRSNPPSEGTLLEHMLGPTGNLRAPTMRNGKTLVVGFNEEVYAALFGGSLALTGPVAGRDSKVEDRRHRC